MKKIILFSLLLGISGLSAYAYLSLKSEKLPYILEKVERKDIIQTVSVTGQVEPDPRIELQFQKNGKIANIYVKEGQKIEKGTILARLENDDLQYQVNALEANLAFQKARLDQEMAGAKDENIAIAKIKIEKAEKDLSNTNSKLSDLKKSNQAEIRSADLAIVQIKVQLEKANSDVAFYQKKLTQDVLDANLQVTNNEISLQNAETKINDVLKTGDQNIQNGYLDIQPILEKSLIIANDNLQAVNNILGIDSASIVDEDKVSLGAKDPNSIINAEIAYKEAKTVHTEVETSYHQWKTTKSSESLKTVKDAALKDLEKAFSTIEATYLVLENSVSNEQDAGLSSELKRLKDFIITEKNKNSEISGSLTSAYQRILTSLINKDANLNNAIAERNNLKNQLENAKSKLELIKISAENNLENAHIALKDSQEQLKKAEQELTQIKINTQNKENDLSSQIKILEVAVKNSQAELYALIAKPREVDLRSLISNIDKAQSDLNVGQFNFNQTLLTSPTDGIVVKINKNLGENITSAEIFVILDSKKLLIIANVSETDISKIQIQDKSKMTFDAFGFDELFEGEIVEIDPAETVIEGVIYYKIKITFSLKEGKEVKSGMTVNIDIETDRRQQSLAIPLRAIKYQENKRFVQVVKNNQISEKEIKVGLEGDQFVEVLEGLNEGEEVVTYITK